MYIVSLIRPPLGTTTSGLNILNLFY